MLKRSLPTTNLIKSSKSNSHHKSRSRIKSRKHPSISSSNVHSISPHSTSPPTSNLLTNSRRNIGIPKPAVKRLHQNRLAKTGIVGAGPTGLTIARIAQVMGYQSPITLIDRVAPGRIDPKNNKRNHALMISSQSLDGLALVDPRLYRRLLSLGRFDTLSGFLDWNDSPTKLFAPKEDPNNPFPRWVNHLCLPRDAYGFAVMSTPMFDIPSEVRKQIKEAREKYGDASGVPKLPQIGIQVGNIVGLSTPTADPEYKRTFIPIVKLIPDTLQQTQRKLQSLGSDSEADQENEGSNPYNVDSDWEDDTKRNGDRDQFSGTIRSRQRREERSRLQQQMQQIQKQLEYHMVIAADGLSSDLYKHQYSLGSSTQRLLPAPNNNIRVFGWTRTSELKNLIGQKIHGYKLETFDDAFRRVNSRIWTRHIDGLRFTTTLMDYPPLHLYNDLSYHPKETSELPDWIYWELQVAQQIWTGQTKLPLPIAPAVNNIHFQSNHLGEKSRLDEIVGISHDRTIDDGVMMFQGAPIRPKDLFQIGQLADHPFVKVVIAGTEQRAMTVERAMYNPISNLKKASFHDHVLYAGDAAFGNLNDTFSMDSVNIDQALIYAMSIASNGNQGPEYLARSVANMVDKSYMMRASTIQQKILEDSVYFGEPGKFNQGIAKMMEKWFPPAEQTRRYEQIYRFNPLRAWEIASSETSKSIFERNRQYRESIMQGFLDGQTRKLDFGDIPLDDFDLNFKPKTKLTNSPYIKGV